MATKLYGLIGYPLSHSFSKRYFTRKFNSENIYDCEYRNFEIPKLHLLPDLLEKHQNLLGLSVTIPHKESILEWLDEIDEVAQQIGAVNAVKILQKQNITKLIGYNTDCYGFQISLQNILKGNEKHALIFGSGGASKAVQYALRQLNINFQVVSRQAKQGQTIGYHEISPSIMSEADIFVNTTPVGMYPNINETLDLPFEYIKSGSIAYDLTYNPPKTLFLQKAEKNGAITCNGLKMLELQAEKAWEIFNSD